MTSNDIELCKKAAYKKWERIAQDMVKSGFNMPTRGIKTNVKDAYVRLVTCYQYCLSTIGETFQVTPEIKQVAEWLTNNEHKGLFLYGTCGRGKTFLARYVLPMIFKESMGKLPGYFDMTYAVRHTDEVLRESIIILDDLGTEQKYQEYGTVRDTLAEIVDTAEKQGKMLIVTTNLTGKMLEEAYGTRTYDRLLKLTKRVKYTGESFRRL